MKDIENKLIDQSLFNEELNSDVDINNEEENPILDARVGLSTFMFSKEKNNVGLNSLKDSRATTDLLSLNEIGPKTRQERNLLSQYSYQTTF